MTKFKSHLQKILALSFVVLSINSCDPGCVEAYQFDTENRYVNAKPEDEGIFGDHYNDTTGGEIAGWKETGLRTDGSELVFELKGAWTSWDEATSPDELALLPSCKMCFKRSGLVNSNCLCESGQTPTPEKDSMGNTLTGVDCVNNIIDQNDPSKCTCTTQYGDIDDIGVYSIALNYQSKDEVLKTPDDQDACRYEKGIGLYVALFGKGGYTMPLRIYHMYPTTEICDITRDIDGKCIDIDGNDQTKYVYKSPKRRTFIKDDNAGNNGTDTDPNDDTYHTSGEYIKFIINDRYYSDNYGGYDINLMSGFLRQDDNFLLEHIVGVMEDALLGKMVDGKRQGGVIEFLFNSIIKDSSFILIVQLCLTLYIVIFGIFVLIGSLEISRKELSLRILKIGLVILFTTEGSWYFYNQIVVGFFKDSMDYLILIFMNASDSAVDPSSMVVTSQLERAINESSATRFAFVDVLLRKLYSTGVAKKILGLFFGDFFGWLYILIIYALIFGFTLVMVFAALMYIKLLIGLLFVLALGPIFMITILFTKTQNIFKRWLSFVASQAIQIVFLFMVLYLFAVIIDKTFNELLYYRACTVSIPFGLFDIPFLQAEIERPMGAWFILFIKIAALLFLLKMVMDKIPIVGHMIVVSGQAADTSGTFLSSSSNYATSIGRDLFGKLGGAAGMAWKKTSVSGAWQNTRQAIRSTGLGAGFDAISKKTGNLSSMIPARYSTTRSVVGVLNSMPMTNWNNYQLNKIIKSQKGKNTDKDKIRAGVYAEGRKRGFSDEQISRQLDRRLVVDPMKRAIAKEARTLKQEGKSDILLDQTKLHNEIANRLSTGAEGFDRDRVLDMLKDKDTNVSLGSDAAARAFAGDKDAQRNYIGQLIDKDKKEKESFFGRTKAKLGFGAGQTKKNFTHLSAIYEKNPDAGSLARALETSAIARRGVYRGFGKLADAVYSVDYSMAKDQPADLQKSQQILDVSTADETLRQRMKDERDAIEANLQKVQEDLKNEMQKSHAALMDSKSQIAVDNSAAEDERAKKLKEALEKYESGKKKLAIWQDLQVVNEQIRQQEAKPELDTVKINSLIQQKNKFESDMNAI